MFGSTVLEVAIGLMLVYLLLSLVCSAINEYIARLLNWRSTTLENGIKTMLDDLQDASRNVVAEKIYQNPLIRGLIGHRQTWTKNDLKPTYIPARTFALAFLDIVAPSQADAPNTFQKVRTAVSNLPETAMRKSLLGLLDAAEEDLNTARKNIERWFDETMDQVSAWYRRAANTMLFFVAAGLCLVMNADSVAISASLWRDPSLRASVLAAAAKTAQNRPKNSPGSITNVQEIDKELQELKIPLGWTSDDLKHFFCPQAWSQTLEKTLGILFTVIAISLGAPFWFDLLNKVVNLRAAGNKPEKTVPNTPPIAKSE